MDNINDDLYSIIKEFNKYIENNWELISEATTGLLYANKNRNNDKESCLSGQEIFDIWIIKKL